jgi:hypothetical protein
MSHPPAGRRGGAAARTGTCRGWGPPPSEPRDRRRCAGAAQDDGDMREQHIGLVAGRELPLREPPNSLPTQTHITWSSASQVRSSHRSTKRARSFDRPASRAPPERTEQVVEGVGPGNTSLARRRRSRRRVLGEWPGRAAWRSARGCPGPALEAPLVKHGVLDSGERAGESLLVPGSQQNHGDRPWRPAARFRSGRRRALSRSSRMRGDGRRSRRETSSQPD